MLIWVFNLFKGQTRYFSNALDGVDTGLSWLNELADKTFDKAILKDVDIGNPGEESLKCPQAALKKGIGYVAAHLLLKNIQAEVENLAKLRVHLSLKLLNFGSQDRAF